MSQPVKYVDSTFTELFGNPVLHTLDNEFQAPLAAVITLTPEEMVAYGVYLAVEFVPDSGYHITGTASYSFPDPTGQPYYVQQTYSEEADSPPPPTLEERVAALEADWASGGAMRDTLVSDIDTLEAAIASIPTAATSAPPEVASSSAVGTADTVFSLSDHTHQVNTVQSGQISALQTNVGTLLSLTGGLNTPAPATATPLDLGTAAVGVSSKFAKEDHRHNTIPVAVSTPTRVLGTAFQPSTTKQVLVSYSVKITCTASLAGGQDGKIELLSDASNPPTTVRATAQNQNSVSLAIALTAVNAQTLQLSYWTPPGHFVLLKSTQTTGTPTFSIINQVEQTFG